MPPVGFLEGVIYDKFFTRKCRESKKPPPLRDGSLIFSSFPKVEVGELDQVGLIMKTSTPKIGIYLLGVIVAVLFFHLLPKVSISSGEAKVIVKGRFASAL